MRRGLSLCVGFLVLALPSVSRGAGAGEVAIYTGATGWLAKARADEQADICRQRLEAWGVTVTVYSSTAEDMALAEWVADKTGDGYTDVLILYGYVPPTIYAPGNTERDGSLAERFIETTDGDLILNHADYFFYVSSSINGEAGLQNLMDIGGITMWGDNTPMSVTAQGKAIAPSLTDFLTDRPFHVNALAGNWFVEASLAQNADGTRADPIIVRDGNLGRIGIAYQTYEQNDPKGAVAAEIVAWLFGISVEPTALRLSHLSGGLVGQPIALKLQLLEASGGPVAAKAPRTVNLASDSATGKFDVSFSGAFDGSVTSVTIPTGESSVKVYYKDSAAGRRGLSASAAGLTGSSVTVVIRARGTPGEVLIYTGHVNWIDKGSADAQARICQSKLNILGIRNTWLSSAAQQADLANWVVEATDNGKVDVLVLYGYFPPSIYPGGNAQPEGSIAEQFIESRDGDAIINHADYMFYVSSPNNDAAGLQNMMDIPGITMWGDDTPMVVTEEGRLIAPSLSNYLTDRPFHVDELSGNWFVEAVLAQDLSGLRADPIIVRDGDFGRLIPCFQTAGQHDPKGAVAAEIIAWLFGVERGGPSALAFLGRTAAYVNQPLRLTVQIQDLTGSPATSAVPTVVSLLTTARATGAFDFTPTGAFERGAKSVTIPAGESSAVVYYRDTAAGAPTLTASAVGLTTGTLGIKIFAKSYATPGEVAIYTGATGWISKAAADVQAEICAQRLMAAGIPVLRFASAADDGALAEWVEGATGNRSLDVLVLFGYLPSSIYPSGNAQPDGSILERFLESTDGDAVLNHADYMFYVSSPNNDVFGLQNVMDIPGITMWGDNTPMIVTDEGRSIAPSLTNFLTDRPFHLEELAGDWLVEAVLAQNAAGTLADPVIVRDGDRGRLITCFQTADQADPKGAVAAEIIAWLMRTALQPTQLALFGSAVTVTGTPVKFRVALADDGGVPTAGSAPVTVEIASSSPGGAFDAVFNGAYAASKLSLTIPAGERAGIFYYKDSRAGDATLTARVTQGLALRSGQATLTVLEDVPVRMGEVAIFTGATWWISKTEADAEAQITIERLRAAGISSRLFPEFGDMEELANWVFEATDNGALDVLIIYGHFPRTIYPSGNVLPDGSIAEAFIESNDGDMILNHADYMFYVGSDEAGNRVENAAAGLQNMMDIAGITMWDDNTPVTATPEGKIIAPSLPDSLLSDRPFHVDELAGAWFVEASLAENASGTRADPIVVRDGNRGRLAPVFQSYAQADPKGAVAAEIIIWLKNKIAGVQVPIFRRADPNNDGSVNITDGIYILNYLFLGGDDPTCMESADPNDDGSVNITDGIYILNYLFLGGPDPAAPGPDTCGPDPVGVDKVFIGCDLYTKC